MMGLLTLALVWTVWLAAPLAHAETVTLFEPVTGTPEECAFMVAENQSWERQDTGKTFVLQDPRGTLCRSWRPGKTTTFFEPCPTGSTIPADFAWSWAEGVNLVQNVNVAARCAATNYGGFCSPDWPNKYTVFHRDNHQEGSPKPFTCTCGYQMRVELNPPNQIFQCVDVDECETGSVTCPANSQCANRPGSFKCQCDDGFGKLGALDLVDVDIGDECAPRLSSSAQAFSTRVQVQIIAEPLGASIVAFELEVDFDTKVSKVTTPLSRLTGLKIPRASIHNTAYELQELQPGTKHQVRLFPLDSAGERFPGDYAVQTLTTRCSCPTESDPTGKPGALTIYQEAGFVTFTFMDLSMCEEAYAFSRSDTGSGVRSVFTSNYYYYSRDTCASDPYTPGKQAADELSQSLLAVGGVYTYCVRAVAKGYMPTTDSSNEECGDHTVRWEASVDGRVALEKAAGSLPVESVFVEWELLSSSQADAVVIASGNATSDDSGRFKVTLNILPTAALPMTNDAEYPLHVTFAKTTVSGANSFDHTFLCEDGIIRCTDTGTTMFLRHLDFNEALNVVDDSSVALTGKVVIGGTDVFDPTGNPDEAWNEDGCPVVGATVCLVDHTVSPSAPDVAAVCVETNGQGEYSLPAVIGTIVHPEVTMLNHIFLPLDSAKTALYETGITIKGEGNYISNDFVDTSTNPLLLELAGGMCDHFLGDAVFRVTKPGCDWPGVTLAQGDVRAYHNIIAHEVEVAFDQVTDPTSGRVRHDIALALAENKNIDLRELEDEVEATSSGDDNELVTINGAAADQLGGISAEDEEALEAEEQDAEENSEAHRLRFQFDGIPLISAAFKGDLRNSCGASDTDAESFHVLRAFSLTNVTVTVVQDLGENIPTCDHLPPDFSLNIVNELGFSDSSTSDQDYIELLRREYDETDERIALFEKCNNGCNFPIQHTGSVEAGDIGEAHVTTLFLVGPPNILESQDFLKQLRINTVEPYEGFIFVADALVIGDYDQGNLFSFPAPTHEPIMVLRDPPGSNSYAVYENVQTTSQVIVQGHETFVGFSAALDLSFGNDFDVGVCAGVGVQACKDLLETKVRGGLNVGGGGDFEVDFEEKTNTATFTSTWSYTTSTDFWNPGQLSDVFVVPTLNVRFNQIQEIRFDEDTCAGVAPPIKRKFDVDAPAEKAVAFLTYITLTEFELPEMERIVADKEALLLTLTEGSNEFEQVEAERNQTQVALSAWAETLANYGATNLAAADNEGGAVKPHEWFDSKAVDKEAYKEGFEDFETRSGGQGSQLVTINTFPVLPEAHWSGLVPEALNAKRKSLDPDDNPDLEETNVISFDGGGSEFSFWLSQDKDKARKHKFGHKPRENSKGDFHFAPHLEVELSATLGVDLGVSGALTVHHESQLHYSENSAVESKVGFVLGDADVGDMFNVRVNLDPDFGTFIFTTTSGQSKCPHEPGTNRRESPSITVTQSPQTSVLPDEPMVFHLQLANEGVTASSFQLAPDNRDNVGDLNTLLNGKSIADPQQYDSIGPGETVETTITLTRGPELYEYPPIHVIFRSACEGALNIGDGNLLVKATFVTATLSNVNFPDGRAGAGLRFEEPCPKVSLAGQVARDGKWLVNADDDGAELVTVVVRNPSLQVAGSFFDQAADAKKRLEKVELLFRKQGTISWDNARIFDRDVGADVDIDFAKDGVEDPYGFGTISWDVSAISDGDYEIMVRTVCDHVDGAQADFNKLPTDIIPGTIDRQRPRQYGLPSPPGSDVYVGQDVSFTFQEDIDCRTPFRFSLDVLIDGRDPLGKGDLLVVCEGRTLSFMLDPAKTRLDEVVGLDATIQLSAVKDMHLNEIAEPIEHSLRFAAADATSVIASFDLSLDVEDCATMLLDTSATAATVVGRVLEVITVDESRVRVASVRCSSASNTALEASVTINPEVVDEAADGERRLRNLQSDDGNHNDAMHLVYALQDGAPSDFAVASVVVAKVLSDADTEADTTSVVYLPSPEGARDGQLEALVHMMAQQSAKLDAAAANQEAAAAHQEALEAMIKAGLIVAMSVLLAVVVLRGRNHSQMSHGTIINPIDKKFHGPTEV